MLVCCSFCPSLHTFACESPWPLFMPPSDCVLCACWLQLFLREDCGTFIAVFSTAVSSTASPDPLVIWMWPWLCHLTHCVWEVHRAELLCGAMLLPWRLEGISMAILVTQRRMHNVTPALLQSMTLLSQKCLHRWECPLGRTVWRPLGKPLLCLLRALSVFVAHTLTVTTYRKCLSLSHILTAYRKYLSHTHTQTPTHTDIYIQSFSHNTVWIPVETYCTVSSRTHTVCSSMKHTPPSIFSIQNPWPTAFA